MSARHSFESLVGFIDKTLVITELVAQALQGTAKLDFNRDGIHWRLDIPQTFVLTEPPTASPAPP